MIIQLFYANENQDQTNTVAKVLYKAAKVQDDGAPQGEMLLMSGSLYANDFFECPGLLFIYLFFLFAVSSIIDVFGKMLGPRQATSCTGSYEHTGLLGGAESSIVTISYILFQSLFQTHHGLNEVMVLLGQRPTENYQFTNIRNLKVCRINALKKGQK